MSRRTPRAISHPIALVLVIVVVAIALDALFLAVSAR
jgi:hypothetical protein